MSTIANNRSPRDTQPITLKNYRLTSQKENLEPAVPEAKEQIKQSKVHVLVEASEEDHFDKIPFAERPQRASLNLPEENKLSKEADYRRGSFQGDIKIVNDSYSEESSEKFS